VSARAAWLVGAGIFLSRIAGFVREAGFAFFFGNSAVADVWRAALRTPNVLQNLLGEGTLSASFIPVYAEMLEEGREEEAGRFAGAILGLLATVAFGAALIGVLTAPLLVRVFYFEWPPWQQALAVRLIRILFLMTGVLAVSAWALGVLNSHRRFFVSYVAPVAWNLAILTALGIFGLHLGWPQESLVVAAAWGALVGGVLQLAVQLPWVVPVLGHFRLSLSRHVTGVNEAIRNFVPVVGARGVVNLSGWLDTILAHLLAVGALAALGYAQTLYLLPISLFGMSIAASELPELSRRRAEPREALAERVSAALGRIAFLLVPSTAAYLAFGDVLVGALFQRGAFEPVDTALVYAVLAAYSLGLPASSSSRVLSSAFYALRDTRTPARVAYLRVALSLTLGAALMFPLDTLTLSLEGETRRLGAAGLALGASLGSWVEYLLLRRRLGEALGSHGAARRTLAGVLVATLAGAVAGVGAKGLLGSLVPYRAGLVQGWLGEGHWALGILLAMGTAMAFGVTYLAVTSALGVGVPLRRLLRR
jgi:putative peptidoglycan lipid II flippase